MYNFEKGAEAFSEEIAESNARKLKNYLTGEFLADSISGTETAEIKGRKYLATLLSGVVDNETGNIVSINDELYDPLEEFRRTTFQLKVLVSPIYKDEEEMRKSLQENPSFPPEVVEYEVEEYSDPRVRDTLDRSLQKLAISFS